MKNSKIISNILYNLGFDFNESNHIINKLDFSSYKLNRYFISQLQDLIKSIEGNDKLQREIDNFLSFYYNGGDFGYFKNKYDNYSYRIEYKGEDTKLIWSTMNNYYIKTSDENNKFKPNLGVLFTDNVEFIFEKVFDENKEANAVEISKIEKNYEDEEAENVEVDSYSIKIFNLTQKRKGKNTLENETLEYLLENIKNNLNDYFKSNIGNDFIKEFSKNGQLDDFFKKWTKDYFIHKGLKDFLKQELFSYIWDKYGNANIGDYNNILKKAENDKFENFIAFLKDENNKINNNQIDEILSKIEEYFSCKLYKKDEVFCEIKKLSNGNEKSLKDIINTNNILKDIISKLENNLKNEISISSDFWEDFRIQTEVIIDILSQIEELKKNIWLQKRNVIKSDYVVSLKTLKENLSDEEFNNILKIFKFTIENNENFKNDIINILKDKYRNVDMISSVIVDCISYDRGLFKFNYLRKKEYGNKIKIIEDKLFSVNKNGKEKELGKIIYIKNGENNIQKEDLKKINTKQNRIDIYFELSEDDYKKNDKIGNNFYIRCLDIRKDFNNFYIDTNFIKNIKDRYYIIDKIIKIGINGTIIKSENYQALNTINEKFKNSIDLIWIDPPFNTNNNQFLYKDSFLDSSWCSMIDDRLNISSGLLSDKGSFYMHLDENANCLGRSLLKNYFYFQNELIADFYGGEWIRGKQYIGSAEYVEFFTKNSKPDIFNIGNYEAKDLRTIYSGFLNHRFSQFNYKEGVFGYKAGETTQKTEDYLQKFIRVSSNKNSIVMDYFAGTGTTLVSAHKLGRKWIGINISEIFNNIFIQRMKKVLIGDMGGISKEEDIKWQGGGAFKYFELENYEDIFEGQNIEEYISKYFDGQEKQIKKQDYENFYDYINNYKFNTIETKDYLQSIIYDLGADEISYFAYDNFVILQTNKGNFAKFFDKNVSTILDNLNDINGNIYLLNSDYHLLLNEINEKNKFEIVKIKPLSKVYFN